MGNRIMPEALKIWLIFLFVFLVLGYGIFPSIGFGAVAGFAGGLVATWWSTPGGEPKDMVFPAPIRQIGRQLRQTPSRLPFGGLWQRRNRRSPGSRR